MGAGSKKKFFSPEKMKMYKGTLQDFVPAQSPLARRGGH